MTINTSSCLRLIPDILGIKFFRFVRFLESFSAIASVNFVLSLTKACRDFMKSSENPTTDIISFSEASFSTNLDIPTSESFLRITSHTSEEDKIISSPSLGHMAYNSEIVNSVTWKNLTRTNFFQKIA